VYNGSQLTCMTVDGHTMYFSYDAAGTPLSITFDGTEYFYLTNIQGDVTGIVDAEGQAVATYHYDAWGNRPGIATFAYNPVSTYNPLRYRGYVYDQETGLYYLQSRYYNPELYRFINADGLIATGQGLLGNNMFAYCNNNPVMHSDPSGYLIFPIIPIPSYDLHDLVDMLKNKDYEYIEDQNDESIANKSFGVSTVGHAGCAAVAVYNAMIMLGNGKSFNSVLRYFNRNILRLNAGGLLGANPSLVEDYFLDSDYRVVTTSSKKLIDQHSQTADACILYYMYNDTSFPYIGAHYVAYCNPLPNTSTKRFKIFNENAENSIISNPSEYAYGNGNYNVIGIFIYK